MFCTMLFVLASDFMIRGMDDQNLQGIREGDLTRYQLVTLLTLIAIGLSTSIVRKPYEVNTSIAQPEMRVSAGTSWLLLIGSVVVVLFHTGFRLNAVDWSFQTLLDQMLGPRDTRIWDQPGADGARSAVYQLVSGMVPLAATIFAFVVFSRRAGVALIAAGFFVLVVFVLITDGSRTQAILPLASLAVFGLLALRSFVAKMTLVLGVVVLIALATSAMILFRANGLEGSSSQFAFTYHQDDNIYRAWAACAYADFSNSRWDLGRFFYYILSNPIPRSLGPDKPVLDENFYGGFKVYWVTISFIGEWVAMFGTWGGFVASFLFGNLLYRGFYFSQQLLTKPLGLTAYLLIALYVYMVIRGMPNLTTFSYAPLAALLLVYLASRRRSRAANGAIPMGHPV